MPEIQPVGASAKVFCLIHSDSGVGKTTLIGSGGKKFKELLIRTPISHSDPIIGSGVMEMICHDWEEIFEALDYCRHEGHKYDWVWFEDISLTQDVGLDDVYVTNALDKKGPIGSQARKERERWGPDQGEYRVNMWRLGQWVRYAVGAGQFNLGITAHSFYWEPKSKDVENYNIEPCMWPWIQGKGMPSKICGMMNVVGYMEVKTRKIKGREREIRVLHTNKSPDWYAKCQIKTPDGKSVFGDGDLINPTLPEMMEMISKGRPVHKQEHQRVVRRRTRRK